MSDDKVPVTLARLVRGQWVVQKCPYCGKKHYHGAGGKRDNPLTFLGHRVAHCFGPNADNRGYILVEHNENS